MVAPVIDIGTALPSSMVPYGLSVAGGGVLGFIVGVFIKHAIKIILFVIGGLMTFLEFMAYWGYITSNFPLIPHDALSAISSGSQTVGHALQQD